MKRFEALEPDQVDDVLSLAKSVLLEKGVEVESEIVRKLLHDHGCEIVDDPNRKHPVAKIKPEIVDQCVGTTPKGIQMYDQRGDPGPNLAGDNTTFTPGSCGVNYFDPRSGTHRRATEQDLTELVRVADALKHIGMVSTSVVVDSVDPSIQDVFRLKVAIENSHKPIVTGTFLDNFEIMKDMLVAVRGSEEALKEKPLAIFDCCPSPALKWPRIWSEDLIKCGKYGIPAEFISMPQPGLSSPNTLFDAVVQHTAETLSGVVISQLANPGAPLIYGGSPTMINHKSMSCTALLGDIGTMKVDTAFISVAKKLGLPCQCYLGLSDSKIVDVQSGFEKGMSILLTAMCGVNNVSGPGMLESENCQCKEMLIIDNEFCGAALHFVEGVQKRHDYTVEDIGLMAEEAVVDPERIHFLRSDDFYDAPLADKEIFGVWQKDPQSMLAKACGWADYLLSGEPKPVDENLRKALDECIERARG